MSEIYPNLVNIYILTTQYIQPSLSFSQRIVKATRPLNARSIKISIIIIVISTITIILILIITIHDITINLLCFSSIRRCLILRE